MNSPKVMRIVDCGLRIDKREKADKTQSFRFGCLLPSTFCLLFSKPAIRNPHSAIVWVCLLMLAAIAAHAQEQPSANLKASEGSSSTGTISGRIISDDGRPLSDAVVYVYRVY